MWAKPPMAFLFAPAPPACPPPWQSPLQLRHHLARLLDNVDLLTAVVDELEAVNFVKNGSVSPRRPSLSDAFEGRSSEDVEKHERVALECATSLQQAIRDQVAPLVSILEETCSWEEAGALAKLSTKRCKMLRNRKRRKKRRQLAAEKIRKEKAGYDEADLTADEWRARQIAKGIAKRKVDKMKAAAKKNAKEERQRLERELELVLIVEKLQELREIRIQRMKKQGSFFPEEDNRFLERVRAAVEEEERQAAAAADTKAAAAAIANAQEARKATLPTDLNPEVPNVDVKSGSAGELGESSEEVGIAQGSNESDKERSKIETSNFPLHDGSLPAEFYHYYYGSTVDIGTLIEVRRFWDSFILPGGSRIPGHWVQAPPPADAVWDSCLIEENKD